MWVFCSRAADNLINRIFCDNDNEEALDARSQRDGNLTIQQENLQKLLVEIKKTISHLKSPYMWDLFTKKMVECNVTMKVFCELPPARSQRLGTNSLKFKGSLLWNSISDILLYTNCN